jgi:hypothetical protein
MTSVFKTVIQNPSTFPKVYPTIDSLPSSYHIEAQKTEVYPKVDDKKAIKDVKDKKPAGIIV